MCTYIYNPHHTGHIENDKLHTVDLQLVALFPLLLVFVQIFTGWMVVCTFRLSPFSFFLKVSAQIWSLNGKTTRTVSPASLADDNGCWWS